jgi:tetraacyldisaccharide 4'-kinase
MHPGEWPYYLGLKLHQYWMKKQASTSSIPSVVIGNLSTGGTGKSSLLLQLTPYFLEQGFYPALLTRGYGRKNSQKDHWVQVEDGAEKAGDEPLCFKQTFPQLQVLCAANRRQGLKQLAQLNPTPDFVWLDDGFQHLYHIPAMSIVLMAWDELQGKRRLLPFGPFREPFSALKRAQAVIITKIPEKENLDPEAFRAKLQLPNPIPLFTARYRHALPLHFTAKKAVLITGIARPKPLVHFLRNQGIELIHLNFPDHHSFQKNDLSSIKHYMDQGIPLLTTAKDQPRLQAAGITFAQTVTVDHYFSENQLYQLIEIIRAHVGKH